MLHPNTRLAWIDDQIGLGVIATTPIPKGTIVWALDPLDLALTTDQVAALGPDYRPMLHRYAYGERGATILCWDHARFVNHHCDATCIGGEEGFEVAARDIDVGEQLTDDYATLGLIEPMACSCGSPHCRGVVRPEDHAVFATVWHGRYVEALRQSLHVPQPLERVTGFRLRAALDRHLGPPANGREHHRV